MNRYQVRLALIFSVSTLLISSMIFVVLFFYLQAQYKRDFQANLLDMIRVAMEIADGDLHLQVQEMDNPSLLDRNFSLLQSLQRADFNVLSIQTFIIREDRLISILDTKKKNSENEVEFPEYSVINPQELEFYHLLNSPEVNPNIYFSNTGPIISGYGPIYTSSGMRIGTLKIDYRYTDVLRFERNLLLIFLGLTAVLIVSGGYVGYLVSGRYYKNFLIIEEDIRRIAQGQYISTLSEDRLKEVLTVRKALLELGQHMESELQTSLRNADTQITNLEERSRIMEKSLTVSREINGKIGSSNLSSDIVSIIRNEFHFYYVSLYLIDETNTWVFFQAGTGRAGQLLANKVGKLKFQESEVGAVILSNEPKVETSSREEGMALATPELPLTRSQLTLPLVINDQPVGAVVIQSEDPDKFSPMLVEALQHIAAHVAVTIENAKLLAISHSEHDVLKNSLQQLTSHEWGKFLKEQQSIGFEANTHGVFPILRESLLSPMNPIKLIDGINVQEDILEVPIKIRGRVLGVLSARKPKKDGNKNIWTNDEIRVIQELVDRMTTALDNARLYSVAQKSAERERIVSDITAKVRSSTDIQTIYQTAIHELASALDLPSEAIQISKPTENMNDKREGN